MKVVIDIEANGLDNPTKIWLVVCLDIDTNTYHIFRRISDDETEKIKFLQFAQGVHTWIGHNWFEYDYRVLSNLLGLRIPNVCDVSLDTYVLSKLIDYSRDSHSIQSYGLEFGTEKQEFNDWSKYSDKMEEYCVRDVDICHGVYNKYYRQIHDKDWRRAIVLEQRFQMVCMDLHNIGFSFDTSKANSLLNKVNQELSTLDENIKEQFPPKEIILRYFTPRATKFGTINRTSVPRSLWHKIEEYEIGKEYPVTSIQEFNPSSHKQLIDVLNEADWSPTIKTDTHKDTERAANRKDRNLEIDWDKKLSLLSKYGWKINETNLATLPPKAPAPARALARRILYESRRRTLTEWLGLVQDDERIHGKFVSIGAWTHRMAHQKPNMANILNSHDMNGNVKLLGSEMRSLFISPPKGLLVGVDAEGIQLRIFAHYINDTEFTNALVKGRKEDKTDPHSFNKYVLGSVCKSRAAAKRFIFALLLGAGLEKLASILDASRPQAQEALDRILNRYTGFARLKKTVIPKDARRGYFVGLDGRHILLPGETQRDKAHLAMSGYLQSGEAIIMKMATLKWIDYLSAMDLPEWHLVNLVHDEWQTEVHTEDMYIAQQIAEVQCRALKEVGEELKLNCPLAGSYGENHNDIKTWTIGKNWKVTH